MLWAQRIIKDTSGLNTNFTLSPSYSFHKSSYRKSWLFLAYLYSAGTQHGNLHPAGWPILFCGPTQKPCVSHSKHRKNRERFWKKCRWMDRKCRNKQEKSLEVSVACMAIYWPPPGSKGRTFKLCVLTRRDFNFCVRSSPTAGIENGKINHCPKTFLDLQRLMEAWAGRIPASLSAKPEWNVSTRAWPQGATWHKR